MSDGPFSGRAAAWLAAAAAGSLVLSGLLAVYGDLLGEPPSFGADGYSRSATGHRAALETLRSLGIQVLPSRHRTADKASGEVVVALLEPEVGPVDGPARARFQAIAHQAGRLLLVLPKREGLPDPAHPGWLGHVALRSTQEVLAPVRALEDGEGLGGDLAITLIRTDRAPTRWAGELPAPTLDAPQLFHSGAFRPLLWCEEGTLVGAIERDGRTVLLVSDPDLLETHGLGRGDNALLLVRLLERLGAPGRPVVVDETLHGLEVQPSIARELLRFPLLLATLQALLLAGLLAWRALVRFGRPVRPPATPAGGSAELVESAALLLTQGGHAAEALEGYLRAAREEVARRLHLPGEGRDGDAALRRLLAARGREGELAALERRVHALRLRRRGAEEEAVRAARDIHRWREELTDGAAGHP